MRSRTTSKRAGSPTRLSDGITWRGLLDEAADRLDDRGEARRIVEEVCGREGAELTPHLDTVPDALHLARYRQMVERRASGEPLQYVLGRWGFRTLDVHVDRRVLIPRPETEVVVDRALRAVDDLSATTAVDLGTGSGVIAMSLAAERTALSVWATDASPDAIAVATANLAGLGRAASRVRVVEGEWFDALPAELKGAIEVVVSNPPYVAEDDQLPPEVSDWEPHDAVIAGPTGLEAIERIVRDAPTWLRQPGALVLEIGESQGEAVRRLATDAGFTSVDVESDLTGRPRVLVARRAQASSV
jgi:release factor glutamine methyltransferase